MDSLFTLLEGRIKLNEEQLTRVVGALDQDTIPD